MGWRSHLQTSAMAGVETSAMTLVSPVVKSEFGTLNFMLRGSIPCPICSENTYLVVVSISEAGSMYAYNHISSDGAPNACARRFHKSYSRLLTSDYRMNVASTW